MLEDMAGIEIMGSMTVNFDPVVTIDDEFKRRLSVFVPSVVGNAMISAVPEPEKNTVLLAGIGLLGLISPRKFS